MKHPFQIQDRSCRRGQKGEEGGDGTKREAESPRGATGAKKEEKERMRLVESLSDLCRIQQEMPSDAGAAIQVLEPPKHLPEHFRLRLSHAIFDHPMPEGHPLLIDRNRPSSCNPFTSECPPTIYCPSLLDEHG